MMKREYIRTDRNGTKIYYDWNCPRCGGAGSSTKWYATGCTCWGCGGTGKRSTPKVEKEYTPEYAAKLEARRKAREEKKKANTPQPTAEEVEKMVRETREREFANMGLDKNGIGYIHTGNTYPIKDEIKANGGKWLYGVWIAPKAICGDGVESCLIDIKPYMNEYGAYDLFGAIDNALYPN